MAKANGTAPATSDQPSPKVIADDPHDIAARLAGVTDTLRHFGESDPGGFGNIMYLLADVAEHMNDRICANAEHVKSLEKGGA